MKRKVNTISWAHFPLKYLSHLSSVPCLVLWQFPSTLYNIPLWVVFCPILSCPGLLCLSSVLDAVIPSVPFSSSTRCERFHVNPIAFSDIHNTPLSRNTRKQLKAICNYYGSINQLLSAPSMLLCCAMLLNGPQRQLMQCEWNFINNFALHKR